MKKTLIVLAVVILATIAVFAVLGFTGNTKTKSANTNLSTNTDENTNLDESLINENENANLDETLNANEDTNTNISADANTAAASEVEISVTDNGFTPKSVTVKKGDTVTWTNNASSIIYVAPDDHPTHKKYAGIWDDDGTGQIATGETYSHIFDTTGTFTYHNHLQPTQTGTITVTE